MHEFRTVAAGGDAVLRWLDGFDRIAPVRSRRSPSADDCRGGARRLRLRAAGRKLVDQQHRVHRRPRRGAEHRHVFHRAPHSGLPRGHRGGHRPAGANDREHPSPRRPHQRQLPGRRGDDHRARGLPGRGAGDADRLCRRGVRADRLGAAVARSSDRDVREPARCFRRRAAGRAASLRRAGSHDGRRRGLVTGLLGPLRR